MPCEASRSSFWADIRGNMTSSPRSGNSRRGAAARSWPRCKRYQTGCVMLEGMLEIRPATLRRVPRHRRRLRGRLRAVPRASEHYLAVLRDVARRAVDAQLLVAAEPDGGACSARSRSCPTAGRSARSPARARPSSACSPSTPAAQGRGVGGRSCDRSSTSAAAAGRTGRLLEPAADARRARGLRAARLPPRARARLVAGRGRLAPGVRRLVRALTRRRSRS